MADSSQNGSSSKGFFFNRSLLWKIVVVFILIAMLSVIQFIFISISISTIDNEIDDTFRTITNQNEQTLSNVSSQFDQAFFEIEEIDNATNIQRQINNVISLLNTKIREVEGIYLGYIAGTNQVYQNQYAFVSTQIPTLSSELSNLIGSIDHPIVDKSQGEGLIGELIIERNIFLDEVPSIFDVVPDYVGIEIQEAFVDFSNIVNFKIANLLQWMYAGSNDTDQYEIIRSESVPNSSFALKLNTTIANVDSDTSLFSDFSTMSGQINGLYKELFHHINETIAEVEDKSFVVDNYDNVALKLHIDESIDITTQINNITQVVIDLVANQESLLNAILLDVSSSFLGLESLLNDLTDWSDDSSSDLSARLDLIRAEAKLDLDSANAKSNSDLEIAINKAKDIVDVEISSTGTILLLAVIISIITISGFLILANFQITKPIKHISYWSEKISDGDLSYNDYKSKRIDEIGVLHNNFRTMNKNLKDIILEVKDSSSVISETADDLSSNTQEINATAEEVSAIAQSMAKGSTQQAELISTIVEELQITSEIVDHVISQINYNLRIIHELSEQTNVLALNTAIEAANAGEFGRGFAVISESIRKMASQSKKTTEEVTKDSREVLLQLQTTFSNITEKIENVAAVSEETAASAEEVAASAEELTSVMETVSAKSAMLNDRSSQSAYLVSHFVLERKENVMKLDDPEENGNGEESAKSVE